jgi:hypothetical protein
VPCSPFGRFGEENNFALLAVKFRYSSRLASSLIHNLYIFSLILRTSVHLVKIMLNNIGPKVSAKTTFIAWQVSLPVRFCPVVADKWLIKKLCGHGGATYERPIITCVQFSRPHVL